MCLNPTRFFLGTQDGCTPLHSAAENLNAGSVSALLAAGADPNAAPPGGRFAGRTALHLLAKAEGVSLRDSASDDHDHPFGEATRIVKALLEAGARPIVYDSVSSVRISKTRSKEECTASSQH